MLTLMELILMLMRPMMIALYKVVDSGVKGMTASCMIENMLRKAGI